MADLGGIKAMGKDPQGLAKPISVDENGNIIPKLYGEKKLIAKHLNVRATNYYYGEDVALASDTVIPVDCRAYKSLNIYIENNSNIPTSSIVLYGYKDISDKTSYKEIARTTSVPVGSSITINNKTQGFENINDFIYEGYALRINFSVGGGTEGIDVYFYGEREEKRDDFENAIIAKHLNVGVVNSIYGNNLVAPTGDIIPADYRNYRDRIILVENNTNVAMGNITVYGHVDLSSSDSKMIGKLPYYLEPGEMITINNNTEGFEDINDDMYQGISVLITYASMGTGTSNIYLMGRKSQKNPKIVDTNIVLTDSIREALQPRVFPKSQCEISIESHNFTNAPLLKSIGDDGAVYGTFGSKQLFKCSNGFANMDDTDIEMGQLFTDIPEFNRDRIVHIQKTKKGYVAVSQTDLTYECDIWFSTDFNSGFEKVAELHNGRVGTMNVSYFGGYGDEGVGSVFLVSEYYLGAPRDEKPCRLFASFDHGETWQVLLSLTDNISTLGQNLHWHTHAYDEFDGRIWAVNGDGQNAKTHYSYDMGQTWDTVSIQNLIDSGFRSGEPQATMLIPCEDRVILGHDNGWRPGYSIMYKDLKYTGNIETFRYEIGQAVYPKIGTGTDKYSFPPYVTHDSEIYFTIPSNNTHGTFIIMGSGDGGRSFYKVGSINLSRENEGVINGILGVDAKDNMYVNYNGSVVKVKRPTWA